MDHEGIEGLKLVAPTSILNLQAANNRYLGQAHIRKRGTDGGLSQNGVTSGQKKNISLTLNQDLNLHIAATN